MTMKTVCFRAYLHDRPAEATEVVAFAGHFVAHLLPDLMPSAEFELVQVLWGTRFDAFSAPTMSYAPRHERR